MKLPNLIHAVLKKTAPIDPTDLDELTTKAALWYDQNIKEVQRKEREGEELTFKDKIFKHLDSWYVRMVLAILFFPITKYILDMMRPGDDDPEDGVPQ